MALTNAELTDEVRDLRKRVASLEESRNVWLWLEAMKTLGA